MGEREAGQSPDLPERDAALDARVAVHLRDVPPVDELTRRRHLHAALEAFDARSQAEPVQRPAWGLRSQRVLGAAAAAVLVIIGLGVVASINPSDPPLEVMRAVISDEAVTQAAKADPPAQASSTEENSAAMMLAGPESEFLVAEVAGACVGVVEEELDRQARAAGVIRDPSVPVMVTDGSGEDAGTPTVGDETLRILSAEGFEVIVDLGTCALLDPGGDAGPGVSR